MRQIAGVAQHYDWGDQEAIPNILGVPADGRPWAEWWLGTHPSAPSLLEDGSPLSSVSGELPYLLKLLAAAQPLSLQTHPDGSTAVGGFRREQAAGIAIDSPARIYRDPFAKPELLCALTPFDTLCGFRPVTETEKLLEAIGAFDLRDSLFDHGLHATVAALYRGSLSPASTVAACAQHSGPQAQLVNELAARYPDDASVVVTLLLNRVLLQPGEAVFLGPGNLHAYLCGTGVEIMGASDNVVRGGLTVKHIDVEELLAVLRFEELDDPVVRAVEAEPGRWCYPTPGQPFELWRLEISERMTHTSLGDELLLCTAGSTGSLQRGQTAYLALGESLTLEGPSTVFRVVSPRGG
jgi:mannose-6-phosphate isomerase